MITTTKFCNRDMVYPLLNNDNGWSGDDALIDSQIIHATSLLRVYTRREWELGQYVDYFDTPTIDYMVNGGRASATFTLREKNVDISTANFPVVKFSTGGSWDDAVALDVTAYEVNQRLSQIILYPAKLRSHDRSIQVVYTAGYPINAVDPLLLDVPHNIAHACAVQAAYMVRGILNETSNTKQKQDRKGLANYQVTASGLIDQAVSLVRSEARIFTGNNA